MIKSQRPLGLIFVTKDDTPERIVFMYPHVIETPLDIVEEKVQLDTNSILIESNKLVDGQRILTSAEDSDSDLVEKNEDIGRPPNINLSNGRVSHKNSMIQTDFIQNVDKLNEDAELNKKKKKHFPIKIIAAMLQPDDLGGVPFEVKIDKVRYVCNPWHIRRTAQCIAIVFVLHASCSDKIVEAYQNLSRKLAIAIDTEQLRCGYLRDEMQIIQPFLDRAEESLEDFYELSNTPKNDEYVPFVDIEKNSSLARTLRQVYEDVYNYGIVDVFINDCIQVGFCVDPCHITGTILSPMPIGDIENITKILQPYHSVLFYEDCVAGPDANPYILRFFEHYDLERSLSEIGLFARMPLQQVKAVAHHYILWGCAKIVYPLCNSNVYSTMESNPTTKQACSTFRQLFGQEFGLGSILSSFHPPITLGQFLEEQYLYSTGKIRKQMIIFMLRNNYLTQLHKFLFLIAPDSTLTRFSQPLTEGELSSLSNRIKTQIRQFKHVEDVIRNALLRIGVDTLLAGMSEPDFFWFLSTFISLYPFLTGEYHIEAIMCHKQLDRSAVIRILDLFSDIVIVFVSQDYVIHSKASDFPKRRYFV